jgi:hypothetical protein
MSADFNPTPKTIDRAIHVSNETGMTGAAVLLRAARDGRIALFLCQPENAHSFKNRAKTTTGQPTVALISDDDGLQRGAAAWGGYAFRMARWASRVVVHAAGAGPEHYERAILAAERVGPVLLIETGTASAASWLRVLAAIPTPPDADHLASRWCPSDPRGSEPGELMSKSDDPRARLAKVLPLLSSDKQGERDAAALAAHRIMTKAGVSWDNILPTATPPHREPLIGTWRTTCSELLKHQGNLRAWERGFVRDLPNFQRLSTKQRYCLNEIATRVLRRGEA